MKRGGEGSRKSGRMNKNSYIRVLGSDDKTTSVKG